MASDPTDRAFFEGDVRLGGVMSEAAWAEARPNCVLATVDVMPVRNGSEVYLGLREGSPAGIWWIFGGRMIAGERYPEAAQRVLERELGLSGIGAHQLRQLGYYSLYWNVEGEVDHALLVGHACDLDGDTELPPIPERHSRAEWFGIDDVLAGDFHPCIKQMVTDYLTV